MHTTMIEIARGPTWGLTADCRAAMGLPQAASPLQSSPQAGQEPRGLFVNSIRNYIIEIQKGKDGMVNAGSLLSKRRILLENSHRAD